MKNVKNQKITHQIHILIVRSDVSLALIDISRSYGEENILTFRRLSAELFQSEQQQIHHALHGKKDELWWNF